MFLYTKYVLHIFSMVFLHNLLSYTKTFTNTSLFQNTHWMYTTPTNVNWSCWFIASLEKPLYSYSFGSCRIYIFAQSDGSFIFSFGFSIEEISTCHFQNGRQVPLWNTPLGWKNTLLGSKLSDLYASSDPPLYKGQESQVVDHWKIEYKEK